MGDPFLNSSLNNNLRNIILHYNIGQTKLYAPVSVFFAMKSQGPEPCHEEVLKSAVGLPL